VRQIAQVSKAFKKHRQEANDYCKLFEGIHISNIQRIDAERIILLYVFLRYHNL